MAYAVIRMGGKQLIVNKGDTFQIERQPIPLNIDVLLYNNEGKTLVGTPVLTDVKVEASVVEEKRAKKIRVARFKAKSRYDKVNGHRQPVSIIKIDDIYMGAKALKEPAEKKVVEKAPKTVKKEVAAKSAVKVTKAVKKSQPKAAKGPKKAK